jgi:NAD(P)-dependent dehydrogenase (short-subunit alcohol dehydrogenase family)
MPEAQDLLQPFLLSGRTALVTGASSGLGRHFADVLAGVGARVVLAARRTPLIERARDEICAAGGEAMAVAMDVTDSDSIAAALDAIEAECGAVATIIINNAGITLPAPLLSMPDEDWDAVVATNLSGVARVSRAAAQRMVGQGRGAVSSILRLSWRFASSPC